MEYLVAIEDLWIDEIFVSKGSKYTLKDGELHSYNDLPALIYPNEAQYWFRDGKYHREDGPTVIHLNGTQEWFRNGKYHREDGPAVIHFDGSQWWLRNGKYHREDGPAIINSDGEQQWYKNGELHREDGPAHIYSDGTQVWSLNGKEVDPLEVLKLMKVKGIDLTEYGFSPDEAVRKAFKKLEEGL